MDLESRGSDDGMYPFESIGLFPFDSYLSFGVEIGYYESNDINSTYYSHLRNTLMLSFTIASPSPTSDDKWHSTYRN